MIIKFLDESVDLKKLKVLGGKDEGIVYAYQDYALKIYHNMPKKWILNLDDVEYFSKVPTTNILLPKAACFKDNEYKGAASKLVKDPIPLSEMWETLKNRIEKVRKPIEEDLAILNEYNIRLHDLASNGNLLYNGQIYFCDYGSYEHNSDCTRQLNNLLELKEALHYHLFSLSENYRYLEEEYCNLFNQDYTLSEDFIEFLKIVYGDVLDTIDDNNYFNFLEDILTYYSSVEEYKLEILENALDNNRYAKYEYELNELEKHLKRR